jgi:hypothetical protein
MALGATRCWSPAAGPTQRSSHIGTVCGERSGFERLLTGIDAAIANEIFGDISNARNAWRDGDLAAAYTRIADALRIAKDLRDSGVLPDNRATALLSLGETLINRF